MLSKLVLALAAAQSATAHFGLTYPAWRADTLAEANEAKYSQWTYPCAGVPYKSGNLTDWPIGGGSLSVDLHHPWTYVFVNLGLGENATNFNISLTPQFWNATGKGTLCVEKLPVPIDVKEGTLASLQVVTSGASGSALYNCADIRFTKDAKALSNCTTTKGLTVQNVTQQQSGGSGGSSGNSSTNGTSDGKPKDSAGTAMGANIMALVTVVGLASGFVMGL